MVLPYRITDKLVNMLKQFHPLWINTHFNHPREITHSSREALARLADAGIPLGNQSVLLAGVNDCPRIMRSLVHKLVYNRVRPYYLYQCDLSEGLTHFRTPVGKGIEIMESLIGHTSGLAVPTYVIDAPGGGGKIPVMPNYLISWSTNKVVLRNYEGVITTYKEPAFLEAGYHREGFVTRLFNGCEDGVFLCRYPDPARMVDERADVIADAIVVAQSKAGTPPDTDVSPFRIARASAADTAEMAVLYQTIFASYPFPIHDPAYLRETMDSHIVYFTARDTGGRLVAASSIEMDTEACNAEMTDFAALPACRGRGIAAHLLAAMEREAPALGIHTLFTIARALSYGMNATFARLGYTFGGTLINNTQIAGRIESMNVWHKG